MDFIKPYIEQADKEGKKIEPIRQLAAKTKLKEGYILLGIIIVVPIIVLVTMGATILTLFISVIYPGYQSIKALQTKDNDDDDKQWLSYWTIYGAFTLFESVFGFILDYIPYFFWFKIGLVFWMFLP